MDSLYCRALDLPADKRAELALILLDSLPVEDKVPIRLDPEYEAEIHRRIAASDRGEAKTHSLEEVMAMLCKQRDARVTTQDIAEGMQGEGSPAAEVFAELRARCASGDKN